MSLNRMRWRGCAALFAAFATAVPLLFATPATDALTFVSVPIALIAVAALACALPARRALKIDPLQALRR